MEPCFHSKLKLASLNIGNNGLGLVSSGSCCVLWQANAFLSCVYDALDYPSGCYCIPCCPVYVLCGMVCLLLWWLSVLWEECGVIFSILVGFIVIGQGQMSNVSCSMKDRFGHSLCVYMCGHVCIHSLCSLPQCPQCPLHPSAQYVVDCVRGRPECLHPCTGHGVCSLAIVTDCLPFRVLLACALDTQLQRNRMRQFIRAR